MDAWALELRARRCVIISVMPRSAALRPRVCTLFALVAGCAGHRAGVQMEAPVVSSVDDAEPTSERAAAGEEKSGDSPLVGEKLLRAAESALAGDEPARAVALFARYLAGQPAPDSARQAYLGLSRSHEALRDCAAAIRTYDAYLERFPEGDGLVQVYARRGACHAELEQWQRSATSYQQARAIAADALPSVRVELAAREGFARFQLGDLEGAEKLLKEADAIFVAAQEAGSERFTTYYFVGMSRFYLGAILHRGFRDVEIRLPEKTMAEDFARKFEFLSKAQEAYNYTIKAKHMYWVSAAGYQLGSLFEEFYDALMYAPVPEWLDDKQRQVYYEELKNQLRPVVNKAIWVFEKNLETARGLGYDSEFIDRTESKLAELQGILLAGDTAWGRPHPRLVPEAREIATLPSAAKSEELPAAVDRKLFVPVPSPL
ncbi:MAG TPA: hypothetical protein ENJ18_15965 [Nannocystis exedens]|nr:hypothetical protein [Nannocystis exedens]